MTRAHGSRIAQVPVHEALHSPVHETESACELQSVGVPLHTPPTPESFAVHVQPEPMQFAW